VDDRTSCGNIEKLDRFIFYGLLVFSFFSCISRMGALAAIMVTAVFMVIRHRRSPYCRKVPAVLVGAYIFFICSLVPSLIFSQNVRNDLRPFLHIVFDMVPFLIVWFGLREKKQIIPLVAVLAFSFAVSCLPILYQGLTIGLELGLRFTSFGNSCMITSGFMAVLLPLLCVMVLEQRELHPGWKAGLAGVALIGVSALAINMNRGVWVAIVIVALLYLLFRSRKKIRLAVVAMILFFISIAVVAEVPLFKNRAESIWNDGVSLALSYPLIFRDNPTDAFRNFIERTGKNVPERIYMWNGAWRMFREHPWNGVGIGSVEDVFKSGNGYISPLAYYPPAFFHAHNNFLQFLAGAGIFGFLGFTGVFAVVLWMGLWRYARNSEDWWSLAGFLVTVGFLIQGMTEYNYVHAVLARLYWFVFGLSMAASDLNLDHGVVITEGNGG